MMFAKADKTCAKTHLQGQIFAPKSRILFDLAPRVYIKRGVLSTVLPNQTTPKNAERIFATTPQHGNFCVQSLQKPYAKRTFFHTRVRVFALNSTVLLNKRAFCQKIASCNIENANFATTGWQKNATVKKTVAPIIY